MKTVAKTPAACFARWGLRKCGGVGGKPGPCPMSGEDLHHAIRTEREMSAGVASSRYESTHPMHAPATRAEFAASADRAQIELDKLRANITVSQQAGVVPKTGYENIVQPSTETSIHSVAAGKKLSLFNVQHAGVGYVVSVVPQKGRNKDGYDVSIAPPGGKAQKLTTANRDTSLEFIHSEVKRMMAPGAEVSYHPGVAERKG